MPTSGTYLWSPDLAEMVDDAFERCKVDPSTLALSHIQSARRSINYMLSEWAAMDVGHDWRIEQFTQALVLGTAAYVINPATANGRIIDIVQVALRRSGSDTPIYDMSRQEYLDIPNKTTQGRPSRYFLAKNNDLITLTLWSVPENSTDTLIIDAVRKFQDHDTAAVSPDTTYYMREAFVAGLAAKLAVKFAPNDRVGMLDAMAKRSLDIGNSAQRERGDIVITPGSGYGRRGRRRR